MIVNNFSEYSKNLPFVTDKNIFVNGDVTKYHPQGLHSEIIFGAKNKYSCGCGALKNRCFIGETCEDCGVTVSDEEKRKTQFAKIKIQRKIMLPPFKKNLQTIFGTPAINDLLDRKKYNTNVTNPFYFDWESLKLVRIKRLSKNQDKEIIDIPVYDIVSLNILFDHLCNVSSFRSVITRAIQPEHFQFVFTDEILVIPPVSRPPSKINNKISCGDIDDFYKKVLSLKHSTIWDAQDKSDKEFDIEAYKYQTIINNLYTYLGEKNFLEKESLMKSSYHGKTVEFSQRSTIVPDPTIKPYNVSLSAESTKKMFIGEFLHWLYKEQSKYEDGKMSEERLHELPFLNEVNFTDYAQMVHAGYTNFKLKRGLFERFLMEEGPKLRLMIERAPVLWRFNFSGVELEKIIFELDGYEHFDDSNYKGPRLSKTTKYQNKIMGTNTTIAAAFNLDYDGDNLSGYALQSVQAKRDFKNAFLKNNIEFEHNNSLIPCPEHEAVYAMWALTEACSPEHKWTGTFIEEYENLDEFKVNWNTLNKEPNKPVRFKDIDKDIPYAIACINKSVGFYLITINPGAMPKKKTLRLIKDFYENDKKGFWDIFHEFNKFLLAASYMVGYCNPTFDLKDFAIKDEEIDSYKDTLIDEPYLGFHQNDILFTEKVKPIIAKNPMNSLHRVSESAARIKSVQLLKASSNTGIPTNIHGKAFIKNVKNDLLTGLTAEEFFMSGDSARLALAQRQEAIPKGGELQRKFFSVTGFLKLARVDDCKTKRTFNIQVRNKAHLDSLNGRWIVVDGKLELLDMKNSEQDKYIGKIIHLRYPGLCEQPGYKICDKCFGTKQPRSENLGASIGSYIAESIIQSVLRTHHFSGAFITEIRKDILAFIKRNRFESPGYLYTKDKDEINKLLEIYAGFYAEGDIEIVDLGPVGDEFKYEIIVHNAPYNDDSVKKLNKIISIIDKDRDNDNLISPEEMYSQLLDEVVLPNGILSIYIELIISLLYYDKNGTIMRYGGEAYSQIALKHVIVKSDPRLTIYYTFNASAISYILKDSHKRLGASHMYNDLLKVFS